MPDLEQVKAIIGRLDGLREPIKTAGPTLEYAKLQVTLAEAESRYDSQIAADRLLELYFYIDELTEPVTKLATLAVLAYVLKKLTAISFQNYIVDSMTRWLMALSPWLMRY
jgi:hypothetical protein